MSEGPILPGRLGSPDLELRDDPRADPRMVAVLEALELAGTPEPLPFDASAPVEALHAFVDEAEPGYEAMFEALLEGLAPVPGVVRTVEVIRGVDGNDITLFVHRPEGVANPLPGVLHIHGGGMVMLEAAGAAYERIRSELAATGMVVVGVEFRNASGKHGPYPYPAGLNDCFSALTWMIEQKAALGMSKIIIAGESGGGNLTLATTMKAKRDGVLDEVAGAYAMCPYISNSYAPKDPTLPSLYENDGFFLDVDMMGIIARLYSPDGSADADSLAWPLRATVDDLRGLPPHVISVNQLDPLRDEGLAYFAKLLEAGVSATSRTVNGTVHAGDLMFRAVMPDAFLATMRDVKGFADSL
ncbi:MAG: alpha/beta hydrolase fold domain-containing protein [Actinomycetota bacterium]|jgi:acetyl esterase/lipase|nr:alpha/beta hydrolase fold domain-containing protein [Actinomycetota bacterium]